VSEFIWPVRVYYEDTDAGGVVYYANYLKFMERARTEWLRSLGFEQDELIRGENVIFAVRSVSLEYLKPARFNDRLLVSARVVERGGASMTFAQAVHRQVPGGRGGDALCQGRVRVACLDATELSPRRLPARLAAELRDGD
jgi:acyl-CoA thioester hydrolase